MRTRPELWQRRRWSGGGEMPRGVGAALGFDFSLSKSGSYSASNSSRANAWRVSGGNLISPRANNSSVETPMPKSLANGKR